MTGPWYPLWYRTIIGWVSVAAVQFIRAVRIKDFRSLPSAELSDVDNIVPIAGPNGSGESNLRRALNLFFNGEVEDGVPLDLGRDYHDPEQKRKTKKLIEVHLDMDFGAGLRADLQQPILKLAGGAQPVTIRKRWLLDSVTREPTVELAFGSAGTEPSVVSAARAVVGRLPPDRVELRQQAPWTRPRWPRTRCPVAPNEPVRNRASRAPADRGPHSPSRARRRVADCEHGFEGLEARPASEGGFCLFNLVPKLSAKRLTD